MITKETFKEKTLFSFEIFPPKKTNDPSSIYKMLSDLKGLSPDYISVTFGAGGSDAFKQNTVNIAETIQREHHLESVAHLPAINLDRQQISDTLDKFEARGISNVLALRGDRVEGIEPKKDFPYAADLIAFIKQRGGFSVSAACYPEKHVEAASRAEDIRHLKNKVDAGADYLITQLFFDNQYFYDFSERCDIADIRVPIQAGIMPVINKRQIERIVEIAEVKLPEKFLKIMSRYENNPEAMRDAGIAYAIDQIVDLVTQGVDGVHLYTMNNPYVARRIYEATKSLFDVHKK